MGQGFLFLQPADRDEITRLLAGPPPWQHLRPERAAPAGVSGDRRRGG
jgi:hypothetical protein